MRIGILGGGQLGRMLALAGYPLGLRFRTLDPSPGAPAGDLAEQVVGAYDDPGALARFAEGLDVATYEFENVPVASVRLLAARLPVYPPPAALEAAQDRLAEKSLFARLGVPTPRFAPVDGPADLSPALRETGLPAVLKTRRLGYDGKGQVLLRQRRDAGPALRALCGVPAILEAFVPFDREVSVIAVRAAGGETRFYPPVENRHHEGILRLTLAPATGRIARIGAAAELFASRLLTATSYVGALAVEFFEVRGRLLANEMAPRVHNSGHWTIEGAETSQFENHLRAIAGLPLGATGARGCAAMLNLIGRLPDPASLLAVPGAHLHLYGKAERPGRKLGHVTVTAPDARARGQRLAALARLVESAAMPERVQAGAAGAR